MNLMKQYFGSKILKKNFYEKGISEMISQHMRLTDFGEREGRTINAANCLWKFRSAGKGVSNLETPVVREVSQPVVHLAIAKFLTSHYINIMQQVTCCYVTLGYVSSYVVAFSVFVLPVKFLRE